MSGTFLDKIIEKKQERLADLKRSTSAAILVDRAHKARAEAKCHHLYNELTRRDRVTIIAEIKRASPSKGIINDRIDVAEVARSYRDGGAAAISVLTEEDHFLGSLDDLKTVRRTVILPILRKDFTISEFQIYESAIAGADAILLIVAALAETDLKRFLQIARDELCMDAIVEVHNSLELEIATRIGADIIGINNRNLSTFDVSLDVSRNLIEQRPPDALMIAESGITTAAEVDELRSLGFDGFLIGETLMRTANAASVLESFR